MKNLNKIYKITEFDPTISTENLGDCIIKNYCGEMLETVFKDALISTVPTRDKLSRGSFRNVASADYAIVLGTNLLSSDMKKNTQWNINLADVIKMRLGDVYRKEIFNLKKVKEKALNTHIILLGVGWHQYQDSPTLYTKQLLKHLLDNKLFHSVRDSYTCNMLMEAGVTNVLNTACPTMWGLSEEHCEKISKSKSNKVVTTLTNYNKKKEYDKLMLNMLLKNYQQVYIWLQSAEDYTYLKEISDVSQNINVIPPTLKSYTQLLKSGDIEYVGTRLHGGIHALNCGCRTLILAVDNRAKEIAKDTNLPVIDRTTNIGIIEERINTSWKTEINIPNENIYKWKNQF